MRVAVVGGGINGLCAAWQLAEAGYLVELYERGCLLGETSTASSKLLHGGLRYLENMEFRLVREALRERNWWLDHVPRYTNKLELCFPVYKSSMRSSRLIESGLFLYDVLSGCSSAMHHKRVCLDEAVKRFPSLERRDLLRVFTFFDAQMDEKSLGMWVAEQAKCAGAQLNEYTEVQSVFSDGSVLVRGRSYFYDCVVNVAGPWAETLNKRSRIPGSYQLDLVRGSHLIVNRVCDDCGYLLEVPGEKRIFFVLPYQGKTLIGTTEVRQSIEEPIRCSEVEMNYLVSAYNRYFYQKIETSDVLDTFAGIRPLIKSADSPRLATREYAIEKKDRLITVFGGKWTTARALAKKVVKVVNIGIH